MGKMNGSMPNGDMAMKGHDQGNMSPHLKDYEKPEKDFAERQFSKTLDYVERQNKFQGKMAKEIDKQGYVGRYS